MVCRTGHRPTASLRGAGTWRRRPDAKWRLSQRQLDARLAEQASILDAASRFVKPGGRLAYVTCSIFPDENQRQVEAFLGRNPAFGLADHEALWQAAIGGHRDRARIGAEGVVLTPAMTGTDGFYFAAMERTA